MSTAVRRAAYTAALVLMAVYGYVALTGPQGIPALRAKWGEIRQLEEENANLRRDNDYKKQRIERLKNDPAEQELRFENVSSCSVPVRRRSFCPLSLRPRSLAIRPTPENLRRMDDLLRTVGFGPLPEFFHRLGDAPHLLEVQHDFFSEALKSQGGDNCPNSGNGCGGAPPPWPGSS